MSLLLTIIVSPHSKQPENHCNLNEINLMRCVYVPAPKHDKQPKQTL